MPNILTGAVDSICFPFPADSSMISINIENYELQCLVDTGVAITAVTAFVWNKYLGQAYPSLDNSDSGGISSVNGGLLNSLGKTTMRFEIQSEVFPLKPTLLKISPMTLFSEGIFSKHSTLKLILTRELSSLFQRKPLDKPQVIYVLFMPNFLLSLHHSRKL